MANLLLSTFTINIVKHIFYFIINNKNQLKLHHRTGLFIRGAGIKKKGKSLPSQRKSKNYTFSSEKYHKHLVF